MSDVFSERYGPWALIIGASEGVGSAYALAMAERGLGVALVARRLAVLEEVAADIHRRTGVPTRAIALDLTDADAMERLAAATSDIDVGLVLYNAGADASYSPFLDQPIENSLAMVQRNCVVPMQVCHHYGGPMRERGRGALVLTSSGAGLVGGQNWWGTALPRRS